MSFFQSDEDVTCFSGDLFTMKELQEIANDPKDLDVWVQEWGVAKAIPTKEPKSDEFLDRVPSTGGTNVPVRMGDADGTPRLGLLKDHAIVSPSKQLADANRVKRMSRKKSISSKQQNPENLPLYLRNARDYPDPVMQTRINRAKKSQMFHANKNVLLNQLTMENTKLKERLANMERDMEMMKLSMLRSFHCACCLRRATFCKNGNNIFVRACWTERTSK